MKVEDRTMDAIGKTAERIESYLGDCNGKIDI